MAAREDDEDPKHVTVIHQVLLVEDSPADAELATLRLVEAGSLQVRHARNLSEARAALDAVAFDAIVLDLDLPDAAGVDALRAAAGLAAGVPVIAVSRVLDEALYRRALDAGAEDAFTKDEATHRRFSRTVLYVIERARARARHQRVEGLLEALPDAILVVSEAGAVTYVNRAAVALFARDRRELLGEPLGFSVRDGEPVEIAIPRRDGERICEMRVVPFDWRGETARLAAIRDLTALKRSQQDALDKQRLAEEQSAQLHRILGEIAGLAVRCGLLEVGASIAAMASARGARRVPAEIVATALAAFEAAFDGFVQTNLELAASNVQLADAKAGAEAANVELEAFSEAVAHDLRAPLRRIGGFGAILREDHGERLGPEGRRYLERIAESVERMTQQLEDLLALSRITRAELARTHVDLSRLARTIAVRLDEVAAPRRVELAIQDGIELEADRSLVQILLENLLDNAYKFTSKRPDARVEVGAAREAGPLVCYVRDNGVGFAPDQRHLLFGVFRRLHTASQFDGTGIGLTIAKRVVHRHGGTIWAEAEVGAGATFYFTLEPGPAAAAAAPPAAT